MTKRGSTAAASSGSSRPFRWFPALLCLFLLASGAGLLVHSQVPLDDGPETISATASNTIYGNGLRPLVEEKDTVQTLNVYGPGNRIVAQVLRDAQGNEEVRYLVGDHLGSTRLALDQAGNVVAGFDYSPFGETAASGVDALEVRYRYTGHPANRSLDSYHLPRREYDPGLSRFASVDPAREFPSPYVYAANNPVNATDPTGAATSWGFHTGFKGSPEFKAFLRVYGFEYRMSGSGLVPGMYRLSTLEWSDARGESLFTANLSRSFKNPVERTAGSIRFFLGPDNPVLPGEGLERSLGALIRTQVKIKGTTAGVESVEIAAVRSQQDMAGRLAARLRELTLGDVLGHYTDPQTGVTRLRPFRFNEPSVSFVDAPPGPAAGVPGPEPGPSGLNSGQLLLAGAGPGGQPPRPFQSNEASLSFADAPPHPGASVSGPRLLTAGEPELLPGGTEHTLIEIPNPGLPKIEIPKATSFKPWRPW